VLPWQRVTMALVYIHFRDNARLGMLVAVELADVAVATGYHGIIIHALP
jgi:hypothetical protein